MTRSSVLLLLTDDHAQSTIGCYGHREVCTPSLDFLASHGIRMQNAYTPSPVCSPARASLLTGRLPSQHGIHDFLSDNDPEVQAVPWLADQPTLFDLFHAAGYTTGLVGKWHLGNDQRKRPSVDYWFTQSMPQTQPAGFSAPWTTAPHPPGSYNRHLITDRAIEFLRGRDPSNPFFLIVSHIATHSPWVGHPERLVDLYRHGDFDDVTRGPTYRHGRLAGESLYATRQHPREAMAQYYAAVHEVDEQVGRLIDELEAQNITETTLIVYTADHGLLTGQHGLWGKGNATRPYNMLDEAIRIPLILSHPGTLLGGQVRAEPVTHCDTFQTLLDHVHISAPEPKPPRTPLPGRSYRALLRGEAIPSWPDAIFGEYGTVRMIRTARWKLVQRHPNGPHELYDLDTDPHEFRNLYGQEQHTPITGRLDHQLSQYFDTYAQPERTGLRVTELPRHNHEEAWRDSGPTDIVAAPTWLPNT